MNIKYLKFSIGIFLALAVSRFIPHPPNFTSLIALSFYVPAIFGLRYIPITLICFVLTDIIIGIHSTIFFTWGSIIFIGFISKYFNNNFFKRFSGVLIACFIFYLVTNFGVWLSGFYGYNINGLLTCYILAIPFFGNTLAATVIYSLVIEALYKFFLEKKYFLNI